MEPLPAAVIAALTPADVEVRFHDDRMEQIPYEEPTDLVGISVETYTARRAYQIASEYRRRGVPVVMGGFHASLCPEEVARYAESVVVGEAEDVWAGLIDDYRSGRPRRLYRAPARPSLERSTPDRRIFQGKRYLPVGLIEAGRGCPFQCEFCAVQTVFQRTQTCRPLEAILAEVRAIKDRSRLIFFVDDNIISHPGQAKDFFRALAPERIRWVSQASINVARDEELVRLMAASGCKALLVGFESLDPANVAAMDKGINSAVASYEDALAVLRRHRITLYGTFVFGYDRDTPALFDRTLEFSQRHGFFLTGFNHLTPFPGTALYRRLEAEGRLLYKEWWLDETYSYNKLPFRPLGMDPEEVHRRCVDVRRRFYSLASILRRGLDPVNRADPFMFRNFFLINNLHRMDIGQRDCYPLGLADWGGKLLEAA
ncbi:MAG: B12-binding domain-containing radical SAM protein [Planctomycetes bacterium]|nr:B12-binding domain-containing radical SAM protein [Planctomycetota bacterium]